MKTLSAKNFPEFIKGEVCVLFNWTDCPDCAEVKQCLEALADGLEITPGIIELTDAPEIWREHEVVSAPSLLYFKDGKKTVHLNGRREVKDHVDFLSLLPAEKVVVLLGTENDNRSVDLRKLLEGSGVPFVYIDVDETRVAETVIIPSLRVYEGRKVADVIKDVDAKKAGQLIKNFE